MGLIDSNPSSEIIPLPQAGVLPKTTTTKRKRLERSTAESHLPNKKTTSSAKSKQCAKSSRSTKSTKTLAPVSTTGAKASRGFWNTSKQEWSKKLWWPTETVEAMRSLWTKSWEEVKSSSANHFLAVQAVIEIFMLLATFFFVFSKINVLHVR